jgi:DNA-binding response OmpR family regulator
MKTVLIIDDNDDVRQVIHTTLTQFGFATCEAASGRHGIEAALALAPDLIILDLNLEGMDGFTTLEAIREFPALSTTPVILMTGHVGFEGFRRGMSCGADDFMQKPFRPDELVEAVISRLVRHGEMLAEVEKRAEQLRNAAVQQLTRELAAPIRGILGAMTEIRRESPSLETDQVFANLCQLNESFTRMTQLVAIPA